MENFETYLQAATYVVFLASIVANFTKTDTDNKIIEKAGKIVNFFALNFRRGKK